jgi:hypothetical protein
MEIFVPHSEEEAKNVAALGEYLSQMYFWN